MAIARTGVRPREGPGTKASVAIQIGGFHAFDVRRALPVPEQPPVEIASRFRDMSPAEDDVVCHLHQAMTLDDAMDSNFYALFNETDLRIRNLTVRWEFRPKRARIGDCDIYTVRLR